MLTHAKEYTYELFDLRLLLAGLSDGGRSKRDC